MGLLIKIVNHEGLLEITEAGELVFLDYDIDYDMLMASMGDEPTPALTLKLAWDKNATSEFLAITLLNPEYQPDQTTIINISKAWISVIAKESRIKSPFEGRTTSDIIYRIFKLFDEKNIDGLKSEDMRMGAWASFFQQSIWRHTLRRYHEYHSNRLGLLKAISGFIRICINVLRIPSSEESIHFTMSRAFVAIGEMVDSWLSLIDNDPNKKSMFGEDGVLSNMTNDERRAFRKLLVGAAVVALDRG